MRDGEAFRLTIRVGLEERRLVRDGGAIRLTTRVGQQEGRESHQTEDQRGTGGQTVSEGLRTVSARQTFDLGGLNTRELSIPLFLCFLFQTCSSL